MPEEKQTKKTKKTNKQNSLPTCGIIRPISAIIEKSNLYTQSHWEEVGDIIQESLKKDFCVKLVSESDSISIIHNKIINSLYNDDMVICDISGKNPNVMFELGIRLAFDKPFVIIADNATVLPFDTSHIKSLPYPIDLNYSKINAFKEELLASTLSTLEKSKGKDFSFLKEFGNLQPFKFDESLPKKEQFNDFANMVVSKISDMQQNIYRFQDRLEFIYRRNRDIPTRIRYPELDEIIRDIMANESLRNDLKNKGLVYVARNIQEKIEKRFGFLPEEEIFRLIQKYL